MASFTDLVTALSAVSSLAVILGVGFVVLQLRQNARLLEATLRQQRSDVSVSLLERITDESFPRRRSEMHAIVKRFVDSGWKDAFESPEDFEIRNFAYIYELIGVMGQHGLVDMELLADVMQGLIVRDWQVFAPHAEWMQGQYGFQARPYVHFAWLAEQSRRRMESRGLVPRTPSAFRPEAHGETPARAA